MALMGKNKGKTVTVQLSDETAAMIDRKLKQWSLMYRRTCACEKLPTGTIRRSHIHPGS